MANNIQFAALFQKNLDLLLVAEATSTFMEANPNQITYNGGKTIKIADIALTGLQDYGRADGTGFKSGNVTLKWVDYSLTQDRGVTFSIDSQDVDESANMATAATVVSEFGRTQVVPEIDAYRYATIAGNANVQKATPAALATGDAFIAAIDKAVVAMKEIGVKPADLVIVTTPTNANTMGDSKKFQTLKNTTTIAKGGVDYPVTAYNEIGIQEVPSVCFRDTFTKITGVQGGYDQTAGKPLNFILMKKTGAAVGIVKADKVRIFAPEVNQTADSYKIDVRVYHDVIIPKNGGKGIYVHAAPTA